MKACVILYHKNINKIYKKEWIDECINSILYQTYKDYYVYDLNYGGDDFNFSSFFVKNYKSFKKEFNNHVGAMNFLLDKCLEDNFDAVFNINLDDYYDENRFQIQLDKIKEGYDIVSSDFNIYRNKNGDGFELYDSMIFHNIDILNEFNKDNNVIAHPCVCYSRNFILNNRYLDEIPREDFNLWKRSINNYKFYICDKILLNYRVHENQITYENRVDEIKNNEELINKITKENIIRNNSKIGRSIYVVDGEKCSYCGYIKDKIRYNFCQKCNKLY